MLRFLYAWTLIPFVVGYFVGGGLVEMADKHNLRVRTEKGQELGRKCTEAVAYFEDLKVNPDAQKFCAKVCEPPGESLGP